jgi:hypothetical protein
LLDPKGVGEILKVKYWFLTITRELLDPKGVVEFQDRRAGRETDARMLKAVRQQSRDR